MRVPLTLNGDQVVAEVSPGTRLIRVLRETFGLTGSKEGCLHGHCGTCLAFVNERLVPTCVLPAFAVFNARILTIEGFATGPEYRDIEKGFVTAGFVPCGFCASSSVLLVQAVLAERLDPSEEQVRAACDAVRCRCSVHSRFVQGALIAAETRRNRLLGRK